MENPHLVAMIDAALEHLSHVRRIVLSTLEPPRESSRQGQSARSKPAKPAGIRKDAALKQVQRQDRLVTQQTRAIEGVITPDATTRAVVRKGFQPRRLRPDKHKPTGLTHATALNAQIPSKPIFVPARVIRAENTLVGEGGDKQMDGPQAMSTASLTVESLAQQWLRPSTI